jgi:uncharacterized protein (TIGR02118 family)
MIKRISLVWKRPELTREAFREIWLGEHAVVAQRLPGLREYTIDFVHEAPEGAPDAVVTVGFDTRAALDAAFSISDLKAELLRTREQFAAQVQLLFVDECTVVRQQETKR